MALVLPSDLGGARVPRYPQSCTFILVGVEFTVFRIKYLSNHKPNPSKWATYHGLNSLRKGPHKNATLDFSLLLARLQKLEKEILFP